MKSCNLLSLVLLTCTLSLPTFIASVSDSEDSPPPLPDSQPTPPPPTAISLSLPPAKAAPDGTFAPIAAPTPPAKAATPTTPPPVSTPSPQPAPPVPTSASSVATPPSHQSMRSTPPPRVSTPTASDGDESDGEGAEGVIERIDAYDGPNPWAPYECLRTVLIRLGIIKEKTE